MKRNTIIDVANLLVR